MSELFLKDEKVMTLKDVEGVPREILEINNPELLPFFLKSACTNEQFNKWLQKRQIPEGREGIEKVKSVFGDSWMNQKSYASLNDQYWIRYRSESWKKVNFFNNVYSPDIGDMFFAPWNITKKKYDTFSPDLTTSGILKKRWIQGPDKKSFLVKSRSKKLHQEPLSEVLVSILAEELNTIPHVKYDLYVEGIELCSICANFITIDKEFVPAYQVYHIKEKPENEKVFDHLVKMCEACNIPDAENFLKWMILIDNLTGNEDRNLGNIGFIRDSNTMEFIGPAPLFDCGNAFWNTKTVNNTVKSKMFGDVEKEICKEMKKKCDVSIFAPDYRHKKLIQAYPFINDVKRENLSRCITERNERMFQSKKIEDPFR